MIEVILDYNLYPEKRCLVNQDLKIVAKIKAPKGKAGVSYGWLVRHSKNDFMLYENDVALRVTHTVVGMRFGDYSDKYKNLHGLHVQKLLSMGTERDQVEFKPQIGNKADPLAVVLQDNSGEIFGWMAKTSPGAGDTIKHRSWIHKGVIKTIVSTIDMDPVQKRGQESVKVYCTVEPTHFMDEFSYNSKKLSEKLRKESFPVEASSDAYYIGNPETIKPRISSCDLYGADSNPFHRLLDENENKRRQMLRAMADPDYSGSASIPVDPFANLVKPWES